MATRLQPPEFTIKSASSSQAAIQGGYYWQLENGQAVDVKSADFTLAAATPIDVGQGEQLTVTDAHGPYPATMDLKIYPEEGNVKEEKITAQPAQVFQPTTQPIAEQSFTSAPYELLIDLPTGSYFILMSGTWQNPFKKSLAPSTSGGTPTPMKPLSDQIAFWVNVQ